MSNMMAMGAVAAGGAIGAVVRYLMVLGVTRLHAGAFPYGTMCVNILGSLLIGLLMARFTQADAEGARLFLVTGILGGFTTFSAFSWDALQLVQRGQVAAAAGYVLGSVIICLIAVAAGFQLGR